MAIDALMNQPQQVGDPCSLATLVNSLHEYLGHQSGIDSDDVEVEKLKSLLTNYKALPDEWRQYGKADLSRNYTRILVDSINGKSNLLFIVWNPHKGSPIHDHADAHCVMKILQGSLKETVYKCPSTRKEEQTKSEAPLKVLKETVYDEGQVAYISDDIGLHHISNPSEQEYAVSLHLYTPPNAAEFGFHIYDEKTGRSSHVPGQCLT